MKFNIKGIKRGRGSYQDYIKQIYVKNQRAIIEGYGKFPTLAGTDPYQRFMSSISNTINNLYDGKVSISNIKKAIADIAQSRIFTSQEELAAQNLLSNLKSDTEIWNKFRGLTRNFATGRFTAVDINNMKYLETDADANGTYSIYEYNNGDHITYIKVYQSPQGSNTTQVSNNLNDL